MKKLEAIVIVVLAAACSKDQAKPEGHALPTAGADQPAEPGGASGGELPPGHPPMGGDPAGGAHGGGGMAMGGGGGKLLAAAADGRRQLGSFAIAPPADWEEKPTSSSMRAAEWRLPGAGGAADGELVVYYFGTGGAGGVEANLERWIGQFQQADGSASKDKATIAQASYAGQKATLVDVDGRYVAAVKPGASEMRDEPEWSMAAAIVESPEGPYYFKMLGPKATVAPHRAAMLAMLSSMASAGNPGGAAPADGASAGVKPAEAKPAEAKPAGSKPAEAKPAEAKPAEAKPAEAKPAGSKPAEAKPADDPAKEGGW